LTKSYDLQFAYLKLMMCTKQPKIYLMIALHNLTPVEITRVNGLNNK